MAIRAFIAIEPPSEIVRALCGIIKRFDRGETGISWARESGMHLTLRFLGDINEDAVAPITKAIKEASDGISRFTLKIDDICGFPDLKNPRVVSLGLKQNDALTALHERIEAGLAAIGYTKEERRFRPHLTLCRVKNKGDGTVIGARIEADKKGGFSPDLEFKATSVFLYKSVLKPTGAEYSKLARIDLT